MRIFVKGGAVIGLALLANASPAKAQGVEFSLGGGISNPLGTFNDATKLGWNGLAGLSFVPTDGQSAFKWMGNTSNSRSTASAVTSGSLSGPVIWCTSSSPPRTAKCAPTSLPEAESTISKPPAVRRCRATSRPPDRPPSSVSMLAQASISKLGAPVFSLKAAFTTSSPLART